MHILQLMQKIKWTLLVRTKVNLLNFLIWLKNFAFVITARFQLTKDESTRNSIEFHKILKLFQLLISCSIDDETVIRQKIETEKYRYLFLLNNQ